MATGSPRTFPMPRSTHTRWPGTPATTPTWNGCTRGSPASRAAFQGPPDSVFDFLRRDEVVGRVHDFIERSAGDDVADKLARAVPHDVPMRQARYARCKR